MKRRGPYRRVTSEHLAKENKTAGLESLETSHIGKGRYTPVRSLSEMIRPMSTWAVPRWSGMLQKSIPPPKMSL